jgi:hypothetical protein
MATQTLQMNDQALVNFTEPPLKRMRGDLLNQDNYDFMILMPSSTALKTR